MRPWLAGERRPALLAGERLEQAIRGFLMRPGGQGTGSGRDHHLDLTPPLEIIKCAVSWEPRESGRQPRSRAPCPE